MDTLILVLANDVEVTISADDGFMLINDGGYYMVDNYIVQRPVRHNPFKNPPMFLHCDDVESRLKLTNWYHGK